MWIDDSPAPIRWVKRHKIWTAVIAVIALITVAGIGGGGGDESNNTASDPRTESTSRPAPDTPEPPASPTLTPTPTVITPGPASALALLGTLPVKGRAPKTGYSRDAFGQAWADTDRNGCDTRNETLRRDLADKSIQARTNGCVVRSGKLAPDPYTAQIIAFVRGGANEVAVDHVVALGDSWQTGAAVWPIRKRLAFANDPLNLLAVDASANRQKSDANAASWLPPNKAYRCAYVARQVAVKVRYQLWVIAAERDAMHRILLTCPTLVAPKATAPTIAPITPSPTSSPTHTTTTAPPKPTTTTAPPKPSREYVSYAVHPGAFCSEHDFYGYTSKGTLMQCKTSATDSRYRWRAA
jgi:hypothetical protein